MKVVTIEIISIHAPRGGSNGSCKEIVPTYHYFNPRSPRGERLAQQQCCCETNRFQSTLPVGGATAIHRMTDRPNIFQSTLPVGGATGHGGYFPHRDKNFNPRSPRGERRGMGDTSPIEIKISIHAPRGGSDCAEFCHWFDRCYFNPRSPRGERQRTSIYY